MSGASLLGVLPGWLAAFVSGFDLALPWLLLLLPLPWLAARLLPRERMEGGALRVPGTLVTSTGTGGTVAGRGRRRAVLLWGLWISLVVAMSGPRVILPGLALPASGRELMIAMDLSGSMERRDFALDGETVSRLAAVKRVGADFIRRRAGDRIGLVIFADQAYAAAGLTYDTASVARALEEATIGITGRSTGIGDGLGLALRRLDPRDAHIPEGRPAATKAVVLLSDGANNAGQTTPKDVADLAREIGVRVYTIALGPRDLADANGEQDVVDTETLRAMAETSGGRFFRVKTTDDLMAVAQAIDSLVGGQANAPPLPLRRDLWIWPGTLALAFAVALLAGRTSA